MYNKISAVFSVFFIAGCSSLPSVGPDYVRPEFDLSQNDLPDAGLPTTNRTDIGEFVPAGEDGDVRVPLDPDRIYGWWNAFGDDELSSLVDCAVSNNLSFLMAQQRLDASRWELVGSYAAFLPQFSAGAGASRTQRGPNTSSMWTSGSKLHRDVFTAGFDASWEIDIFGGSRRSTESAWAQAQSRAWSVADAWVSLTAEVAGRYVELRTTQQRIDVARTNLVLQTETYNILKSRFDSGIGDELAVSQSKYLVDQTLATIPPLLALEESLKNALAVLVGEMPGALHDRLATCPRRDWLLEPARLDGAKLDLVRRRPDVKAAERALAAQTARIGVAKSMWFPRVFINGSLGLESVKSSKLFERDSLYGSLGPSVSWPIFQGGRIYASVKAEEARTREACLAYELALERAFAEVRDAYAAYTQEYHRYEALKGAVKAAQDAVSISNDLYKNGLRDFTAVIDAQRSLLSLAEASVVSRGQITQNLVALYKALGGGCPVEESVERSPEI